MDHHNLHVYVLWLNNTAHRGGSLRSHTFELMDRKEYPHSHRCLDLDRLETVTAATAWHVRTVHGRNCDRNERVAVRLTDPIIRLLFLYPGSIHDVSTTQHHRIARAATHHWDKTSSNKHMGRNNRVRPPGSWSSPVVLLPQFAGFFYPTLDKFQLND